MQSRRVADSPDGAKNSRQRGGHAPLSQSVTTNRNLPPPAGGIPEPGAAGSRVPRPQPLPLRGLRAAPAALRKPELRTEGSRARPQPLPLRGLRAAPAALRKPELRTEGSRVPRPQPLPLRGLRAAPAALRKPGAKRRAVLGTGAQDKPGYGRCLEPPDGGPGSEPLDVTGGGGGRDPPDRDRDPGRPRAAFSAGAAEAGVGPPALG